MASQRFAVAALAALVGGPACLVPVAASAQELDPPAMITLWTCIQEFDRSFHVRCAADRVPPMLTFDVGPPISTPPDAAPDSYVIDPRSIRMPLRGTLLNFAVWRIPLYHLPVEITHAEDVLHAILCGNALQCTVEYDANRVRAGATPPALPAETPALTGRRDTTGRAPQQPG